MAFEFNENSGSLFPRVDNDNDRQPDATGRCKIDGRMYKIAAWKRESASGMEYSSLAFTRRKAPKSRNRSSRPRNRNKASLLTMTTFHFERKPENVYNRSINPVSCQ
jgi:hypothetical protein